MALGDEYPDVLTLLSAIRARPGMFLGDNTIRGLDLFLGGVRFAEHWHDLPEETRLRGFDFEEFERWVESSYNPGRLSLRSFSLAAHLAGSDAAGFDLWFDWYDEFADGVVRRSSGVRP
jgi:hypothetical protein